MHDHNKIIFAHQLCGIAVLGVILTHYFGVYWLARPTVARYIFALEETQATPWLTFHIAPFGIDYGPFGVALFFLISGFVIPFAVDKMGPTSFLIGRLLRIFPTYWAGSMVTLLMVWLSSQYWHQTMTFDPVRYVWNMLLVLAQTGSLTIDLVNWTLAIELKFYVAILFLWPLIKRWPYLAIIGISLALLGLISWFPSQWQAFSLGSEVIRIDLTFTEMMYIPFLLIGTLFHLAHRGKITLIQLISAVPTVMALFYLTWKQTAFAPQLATIWINYCLALGFFSLCYGYRSRFRQFRLLGFIADISFPLYVVHSLSSYVVIRVLTDHHVMPLLAMTIALMVVVTFAYLLHRFVELPTARFGKKIGMTLDPNGATATALSKALKTA